MNERYLKVRMKVIVWMLTSIFFITAIVPLAESSNIENIRGNNEYEETYENVISDVKYEEEFPYLVDDPTKIGYYGNYSIELSKSCSGTEIIENRTPVARHFLNNDGKMTAYFTIFPTCYKDENGRWIDIDNIEDIPTPLDSSVLYGTYYGYTKEVNNDAQDPFKYGWPSSTSGYAIVGADYDPVLFDEYYRGFIEWNTGSIPNNVASVDYVGMRIYISSSTYSGFDVGECDMDFYQMSYRPSTTSSGGTLFDDAKDGSLYNYHYMLMGDAFEPTDTTYFDLGANARTHLKNQLTSDWFAVGYHEYSEQEGSPVGTDRGVQIYVTSTYAVLRVDYTPQVNHVPTASHVSGRQLNLYPTKSYDIVVNYVDTDGQADIQNMYLCLNRDGGTTPSTDDIVLMHWGSNWQGWTGYSDDFTWDGPYQTSITNGWQVHWKFILGWDWGENTNINYCLNVGDYQEAYMGWTSDGYSADFEDDLIIYSMTVSDSTPDPGQVITFSGKVTFEGTSNVYAPDADYWVMLRKDAIPVYPTYDWSDFDNGASGDWSIPLNAPSTAGTHWYYARVRNDGKTPDVDEGQYMSCSINVVLPNTIPQTPSLVLPTDSSWINTITPTLDWSSFVNGGDGNTESGYEVRVRDYDGGDVIIYDTGFVPSTSQSSHTYTPGIYSGWDDIAQVTRISQPLQYGRHYHWHARFRDSSGDWGNWGGDNNPDPPWNFYTGDDWDATTTYYNNGLDGAGARGTIITPGTSSQSHGTHYLGSSDLYDWFRISMTSGRRYYFESTGSYNTYGELYNDAGGSNLVASDDDSGTGANFYFYYVAANTQTYYLRVRAFNVGSQISYTLNYWYIIPGINDAYWTPTTCWDGDTVTLTSHINGFDGSIATFDIFEDDILFDEHVTTLTTLISSGVATTTWVAQWQDDWPSNPPEFYFTVSVDVYSMNSGLLIVNQLAEWTIMGYFCGDNDLEPFALDDFLEFSSIGSSEDINVLIQLDRSPEWFDSGDSVWKDDIRYNGWTGARRFRVTSGMTPDTSTYEDVGEPDMGSASTLESFITWSRTNYGAQHYLLFLWDHGGAIDGCCVDNNPTTGSILTPADISTALDNALGPSEKLDILVFADCLMANVEVYYEIYNYVEFLVGSEKTGYASGSWDDSDPLHLRYISGNGICMNFDDILDFIINNPGSTLNIANFITDNTIQQLIPLMLTLSHTWSTVDAPYVGIVKSYTDTFSQKLNSAILINNDYYDDIVTARSITQEFDRSTVEPGVIDLWDFANHIWSDMDLPTDLRDAGWNLITQIQNPYAVKNHQNHSGVDDINVDNEHGLSIFFPENEWYYNSKITYYESLDFSATNQGWDEFLELYFDDPPTCQVTSPNGGGWLSGIIPITATASDPDGSIYKVEFYYSLDGSVWNYIDSDFSSPYQINWNSGSIYDPTVWVKVKAIDDIGRYWEDSSNSPFGVDNNQPTGSILINNGDTWTTSSSVTLSLTYTDGSGSGVYQVRYSNDGVWDMEPWESPSPTKSWSLSSGDGIKTVYYQIKDYAGCISLTYSDNIILDTTAPTGSIIINSGDAWTSSVGVTLSLTYTDGSGSGVYQVRYSNDGVWDTELWESPLPTKPWTLTPGDGIKTVYYQLKDNIGWPSLTYSDTIGLDTASPTCSININSGNIWTTSTSVSLTLTYTDSSGSGVYQVRYSNDGIWDTEPWESPSPSKPWTLTPVDGIKTVYFIVKDYAGNEATEVFDTIIYDGTAPSVILTDPYNTEIDVLIDKNIIITFSEGMEIASFMYSVEPNVGSLIETWSEGDELVTISHSNFEPGTRYWVNVTAGTDYAGNTLTSLPYTFYFDTETLPTATATGPIGGSSNIADIIITYITQNNPSTVNLYYTKNTVAPYTWILIGADNPCDGNYSWRIPSDGYYGWLACSPEENPPSTMNPPEASYYIYDTTPPTVISTFPMDDEINVILDTIVLIEFDEPMATSSVENSITITPQVNISSFIWSMGDTLVTIHFDSNLSHFTKYTITIGNTAMDKASNCLLVDYTWEFTTIRKSFIIPLHIGWNLFSFPLIQNDTSIGYVLASIAGSWDIVQYYDNTVATDNWKTYSTFKPANLNSLWNLDHTMGFWLHVTDASQPLIIYGSEPTVTQIPLYAGWNLVGYPTLNYTVTMALSLWGTGADKVEVYNGSDPYRTSEVRPSYIMIPGQGYWVHVPFDTVWTITSTSSSDDNSVIDSIEEIDNIYGSTQEDTSNDDKYTDYSLAISSSPSQSITQEDTTSNDENPNDYSLVTTSQSQSIIPIIIGLFTCSLMLIIGIISFTSIRKYKHKKRLNIFEGGR
jgi:hypothetical protein